MRCRRKQPDFSNEGAIKLAPTKYWRVLDYNFKPRQSEIIETTNEEWNYALF